MFYNTSIKKLQNCQNVERVSVPLTFGFLFGGEVVNLTRASFFLMEPFLHINI